jgi:multimeric flavodoxin WrbA
MHYVKRKDEMKILTCVGSYRVHGNTAQLVNLIEEGLHQVATRSNETLEIERVYLGHQDIRPCRGCRVCFDVGEKACPLKDDLLALKAKMVEADGIVIASPVYVNDVSGMVKNWIDRLAFVCHRPEFADKTAYLVATVGSGPTNHALGTLNIALQTWGFHVVGQMGFKMGALMKQDETEARFREKAERIARKFFYAIRDRQAAKPSFFSLMAFKIRQRYWQRAVQDSIDLEYWKNRGWTEPHRDFYVPHQANRVKVATARLAGAVIGRFVT